MKEPRRTDPLFSLLGALFLASAGRAQDPGALPPPPPGQAGPRGLPQGVTREEMWYAPTAEDWKKPVQIAFQRTWDDALAVAEETGKPILVCVNMDGEIASEHYAGVRYRSPEIAALYRPYVCVIASVYRHNPRDYDDEGRRIPCPRFGSVTCGEHIRIEPLLYEQFFDGRRIAPRHICVELDRSETYDVYYAFDTDSVFSAIVKGAENRPPPRDLGRTDLPLPERVESRDRADRDAVETAYVRGTRVEKRALLESALRHRDVEPIDLLRLALFGLDVDLARLARRALAESTSEAAIDLIVEALRIPLEDEERELLLGALARLGETYPRARTLAAVQQGLGGRSSQVDVEGWSRALAGAEYPSPEQLAGEGGWTELASQLETRSRAAAARPEDPATYLELADSRLRLAVDPETWQALASDQRTAPTYARLQFEDARAAAVKAEQLGASGWRLEALLALTAFYLGDTEEAHARAERAVAALPSGEESWNAMAVLSLFAQARQRAILSAVQEKREWPPEWLTDVNATYTVLARHPLGADYHVAAHQDFLLRMGAFEPAARVLEEGLARFPDSWDLHERLRRRILWEKGVDGLEPAYEALLARADAAPNLEWFAGYTSIVAAEYRRRAGEDGPAAEAYLRAITHYERGIEKNPLTRSSADHYVALALAGRARIALEAGDHPLALREILASFERCPQAAAALDGLNLSPADTAKMLRARLDPIGEQALLERLQAALERLDPKLLELPAYERDLPAAGQGRGPGRGRNPR